MSDELVIRSLRCPVCGFLPDLMLNPGQVFCGNDDCPGFLYDATADARTQVGNASSIRLQVRAADGSYYDSDEQAQELGPLRAARHRLNEGPVSVAEQQHEARLRAALHQWGYRCADAPCAVCAPPGS